VLAQRKIQGSNIIVHKKSLTTGAFGNTCEADAVSPEVEMGGCKTQVSTTRGNASEIKAITQGSQDIISRHKPTLHIYILYLTY